MFASYVLITVVRHDLGWWVDLPQVRVQELALILAVLHFKVLLPKCLCVQIVMSVPNGSLVIIN